jgi:hypothetical protein
MSDPIEAAWSAYAKAMDHTGPTVAEENAIRLALDAYHAAQPSDYAELKRDARARDDETSDKLVDAIENLEAQWKQRAEAAEGALQISEAILATQIEEVAVLRARVALLEETLSAIVDEVMDGDIVSAEQIARAAGLAALEKDDG